MRRSQARYDLTWRIFFPLLIISGILWWFIDFTKIVLVIFAAASFLIGIKLFIWPPRSHTQTEKIYPLTVRAVSLLLLCQLLFYGCAFLLMITTRQILPHLTQPAHDAFIRITAWLLFPWPLWAILTVMHVYIQRHSSDEFFPTLSAWLFPRLTTHWQQSLAISGHYYLQQTNTLWIGTTLGILTLGVTHVFVQTIGWELPWGLQFDTMIFASLWMLLFATSHWRRSIRWSVSRDWPSGVLFLLICLLLLCVSLGITPLLQVIPIKLPLIKILPQTNWLTRWDIFFIFWWLATLPSAAIFTATICHRWSYRQMMGIGSLVPLFIACLALYWPFEMLSLPTSLYSLFTSLLLAIFFIVISVMRPWRHLLFRHVGECKKNRIPITQHRGMLQFIVVVFCWYLLTNMPGMSLLTIVTVLPFSFVLGGLLKVSVAGVRR